MPRIILCDELLDRYTPEPAADLLARIQRLIADVPAEHRQDVMIELDNDGDYDQPQPILSLWYDRPETAEEAVKREQEAAELERRRRAERVRYARRILAEEENPTATVIESTLPPGDAMGWVPNRRTG